MSVPRGRRFSWVPPAHARGSDTNVQRARRYSVSTEVDALSRAVAQGRDVHEYVGTTDVGVSLVPSRQLAEPYPPEPDSSKRPSRARRNSFDDPMPKQVLRTGGLSVVGSSGADSIQIVPGKVTRSRQGSKSRYNSSRGGSRQPSPERDIEFKDDAAGFAGNRSGRQALPPRPALPARTALPEQSNSTPERHKPPPLDSLGTGESSLLSPIKSVRSEAPSDFSKAPLSLRSLDGTLSKLEEDKQRSNRNLALAATKINAVQAFKDVLTPSSRSQNSSTSSPIKSPMITTDLAARPSPRSNTEGDQRAGSNDDGKAGVGAIDAEARTPSKGDLSLTGGVGSGAAAASSTALDSQLHNGPVVLLGEPASTAGQLHSTSSRAGSRFEGNGAKQQQERRLKIGQLVEYRMPAAGADQERPWCRGTIVGFNQAPTSYQIELDDTHDGGGSALRITNLMAHEKKRAADEEDLRPAAGKYAVGDVVQYWMLADGLKSPGQHEVEDQSSPGKLDARDDTCWWKMCRVTAVKSGSGSTPFLYDVEATHETDTDEREWVNVLEKHLRRVRNGEGLSLARESSPGKASQRPSSPREPSPALKAGSQASSPEKPSGVPESDPVTIEDTDDALNQFFEEVFAEYATTKDNKGNPLMNNMGARKLFQSITRDESARNMKKVTAHADVCYAAELERQVDMSFRFDLSKAEAKRGLCFKSFTCLMDRVYPGGQGRGIMRQRFREYAGDARAMKADLSG